MILAGDVIAKRLASEQDNVNHPSHYTAGNIECIEAIKASMSAEEFAGYLKGNVMKYIWRYRSKGKAQEDIQKANWYLKRLEAETGQAVPNDCRQCKFFMENNSYGLWQCQITKKPFNADSSIPACEMFTEKNEKGDK